MKDRFAIVLAAGQGTRMKSKLKKELHPILEKPMIQYVLDALHLVEIKQLVTIVGRSAEKVMESIGNASEFVVQQEQLGTAHAVIQAKELLGNKKGTTIVVCGDTPLITAETYHKIFEHHELTNSKATILTTKVKQPDGYGRIIRNEDDEVERIVEHKDANESERMVDEINTGTYCFDNESLFNVLQKVNNHNSQNEYYITDVIEILKQQGEKVSLLMTDNAEETIGINDRAALAEAEKLMKRRINLEHLKNGVSIMDIDQTYISPGVTIESDVTLYPGTMILGSTHIKQDAVIGPNTEIEDCEIGEGTVIRQSVLKNSKIGNRVTIGPFAHIRPDTVLGNDVKVGNFVELKNSEIEDTSKVPHLSYIGDAHLGKGINIGCGTITVNYDGKNKYQTIIEDHAFIGCNSNLIAPVTIESGAFVAAGSTITNDVPKDALAIARAKQLNKEGYAIKFNKQK